jgi:hypothetical protein
MLMMRSAVRVLSVVPWATTGFDLRKKARRIRPLPRAGEALRSLVGYDSLPKHLDLIKRDNARLDVVMAGPTDCLIVATVHYKFSH